MILKIEERIYCEIGPIIEDESIKYSVYDTAISIVDLIEELGMLPPMQEYDFITDEIRDLKWEPEDE